MYKALLCWRYLRTRFLAFVCIVAVMLGVATLVVVNSVMAGFSQKLRDRFHGLTSDIVIESPNYRGFAIPADEMIERIRRSPVESKIKAMTPTIEVFAMAGFTVGSEKVNIPIQLVGIRADEWAQTGGGSEYLVDAERRANPSFDLSPDAMRRWMYLNPPTAVEQQPLPLKPGEPPPIAPPPADPIRPIGAIAGFGITHIRTKDPDTKSAVDRPILKNGDSVKIVTIGAGKENVEPVYANFAICDSIRTEMTEYDGKFIFVPLDFLQQLRGMTNRATHIKIRLNDYKDARLVCQELRELFPDDYAYLIGTWEDRQSSLLKAVDIERGLLNLLLFMIVGVAGFCILAIFSMIVREKTRDIGILKSLGARDGGVMLIFLGYGFLLGAIGSGCGTVLGLLITDNINPIEHFLFKLTGVGFAPDVYYFDRIPTLVELKTILLVNLGAVAIAVTFSVWPAVRAAWLRPVKALRFE